MKHNTRSADLHGHQVHATIAKLRGLNANANLRDTQSEISSLFSQLFPVACSLAQFGRVNDAMDREEVALLATFQFISRYALDSTDAIHCHGCVNGDPITVAGFGTVNFDGNEGIAELICRSRM